MLKKTKIMMCSVMMGTLSSVAVAQTNWDMPTPYADKSFQTVNIVEFTKDIEKRTNGTLKIKIHSNGSLIKHPEIKNAVRSGQVQIGEFILSRLVNENPIFGLDSQPFIATSYEDAQKLWDAQKSSVKALLEKQGLIVLYSVPWPPQGLYTQKAISSIDDLKGMKFRAYNATLEKMAKLAGAAPVQVEVADIPQAFSTGRVEAMLTSATTGGDTKAWDYVSHYYDVQAWLPKNIVVVNKAAFDALDEKTRTAILEAAADAEKRGWDMSKKDMETQTEVLKKNGMKYAKPEATSDIMKGFSKLGDELMVDWKKAAGAEGEAILGAYKK